MFSVNRSVCLRTWKQSRLSSMRWRILSQEAWFSAAPLPAWCQVTCFLVSRTELGASFLIRLVMITVWEIILCIHCGDAQVWGHNEKASLKSKKKKKKKKKKRLPVFLTVHLICNFFSAIASNNNYFSMFLQHSCFSFSATIYVYLMKVILE